MLSEKTLSRIRSLGLDTHNYMAVCEIVHDAIFERETAQKKIATTLQIPGDWPVDYQTQFWKIYPNKKDKNEARKALDKVAFAGKTKWADLLEGLERYKLSREVRRGFVKHPATWLNKGCWMDEAGPEPEGTNGRPLGFFELIARDS